MLPGINTLKKTPTSETNGSVCSETKQVNDFPVGTKCTQYVATNVRHPTDIINVTTTTAANQKCNDTKIKVPLLLAGREKRNVSPSLFILNEVLVDPQSPSSSSSASQSTSANDATFEPTIEMMVNDFDDEQTLNEEEALASFDSQDPDEEIDTLKRESEMPLEELLAMYRALPPISTVSLFSEPKRKKPKKTSSHKEKPKQKNKSDVNLSHISNKSGEESTTYRQIKDNLDAEKSLENKLVDNEDTVKKSSNNVLFGKKILCPSTINDDIKEVNENPIMQTDISKVRRSHLLDLYPEGTFDNVVVVNDAIAGNSKETLYIAEDDEEIGEEEDEDYKKKVMVGISYQATIPVGLSQYGDILPYENEDKLIWEPCQVSEREVEEYLIKIRDIKSNQQGEEDAQSGVENNSEIQSKENGRSMKNVENLENDSFLANGDALLVETATVTEMENPAIVKDNEQALHLLVQCGYDFKEALRRKRLNALPLNDCMSLWSEEECHKFEEGIQKYGKDFLKIRQNQVRTRTMRELVQFYYLWKKSERRDQNFANADTVDHMDIYLNEENEYGSNPAPVVTPLVSPVGNTSNSIGTSRNGNTSLKTISIMTTALPTPIVSNLSSEKSGSKSCFHQHHQQQSQHHKRRTHSCNQSTFNVTNDFHSGNSPNTLVNSAK